MHLHNTVVHCPPSTGSFASGDDLATDTTFGVDCGCDGGDDDGPVPTPTTPAPAPTFSGSSSCAAGSGVTVTSSEFPLLEGCLTELELVDTNDEVEYATAAGQGFIYAAEATGLGEVRWRRVCVFHVRHCGFCVVGPPCVSARADHAWLVLWLPGASAYVWWVPCWYRVLLC